MMPPPQLERASNPALPIGLWVATAVHLARNAANSLLLFGVPGVSVVRLPTPLSERARSTYTVVLSVSVVALAWASYVAGAG